MLAHLVVAFVAVACCHGDQTVTMKLLQHWDNNWEGQFEVPLTSNVLGWEFNIHFSTQVSGIQQWDGEWVLKAGGPDGLDYTLLNKVDKGYQAAGTTLTVRMMGKFSGGSPPSATATFIDLTNDNQTAPAVVHPHYAHQTDYDYEKAVVYSILFYEAQRSGKLPANNRVPWRSDSALGDKGSNNEDLTGGWYDAGDHVKFNFPMAYSTAILAWGYLEWKDAYVQINQNTEMLNLLKWPLDYFIKCHTAPHELYVQVGDGGADHGFWGRPEDMTMPRPAYKITESKPGSDVAGETAAAMAAGYLVFKSVNATYANELLTHARQLFEFATQFLGKYSDSVNAAAGYYRSNDYHDELAWAAVWLYQATGEQTFLDYAEANRVSGAGWGDSWDDKITYTNTARYSESPSRTGLDTSFIVYVICQPKEGHCQTVKGQGPTKFREVWTCYSGDELCTLLYKFTKKDIYKQDIEATMTAWMPGGSVPYTPGGLAWRAQWGALRYAENMALVALMAADTGLHPDEYRCWAISQINYALGDNPAQRSYVVGYDPNPPMRPHHRSSSCPSMPAPCGWDEQRNPGPNPHTLYGALVGGPGKDDSYKDDRMDYVKNEVACDYNAAWQSDIAGMIHMAMKDQMPTCP